MTGMLAEDLKLLKKTITSLELAAKLKGSEPDFLQTLESLCKKFPPGDEIGAISDRIREDLTRARNERTAAFQKALAGYINDLRKSGAAIREVGESWRVGAVELTSDAENGRMRALYNKEVVQDWRPIQSMSEITLLHDDAMKMLENSAIEDRPNLFETALLRAHGFRMKQRIENPGRVPLKDFYMEVAAELLRREMANTKNRGKPTIVNFPLWAFLYNLDVQLSERRDSNDLKFVLDTGSQAEHAKKMSVVLYGLDARTDLKQYCYIMIKD